MQGDEIDRGMQRTMERISREQSKFTWKDSVLFVFEAIGALAPLGLAIATGHLKLGTLAVLIFVLAIVGGIVWGIRSLRRHTERLNRKRGHNG